VVRFWSFHGGWNELVFAHGMSCRGTGRWRVLTPTTLRDRVIGAVEGGASRRETGKRFEIGMSTTTRSVVGWDVTATERMRS
jgi:hypothetical protein